MATTQRAAAATYRCPDCGGSVTADDGSWQCDECALPLRHGAD